MARSRKPVTRATGLSSLWISAAALLLAAACSLDFNSFTYPDEVVTSSTSSSSGSGNGGSGGLFTSSSSSSSSGVGGAGASGGMTSAGGGGAGMGGMGGCNNPGDCPMGTECEQATCANDTCGLDDLPLGDPCAIGGNICDGMGMCTTCQTAPVAATGAAMCPAICGSCNDTDNDTMPDECVFNCTGPGIDICPGVMNCPPGFSCRVMCNQDNCSNFTVNCPAGESCAVQCSGSQGGTDACAGLTINCDQSTTCDLSCSMSGCNNSTILLCGAGKCTGNCTPSSPGTLVCGNSCWCDVDNDCNSQ